MKKTRNKQTTGRLEEEKKNEDDVGPKLVEDLVPIIISVGKWSSSDLVTLARVSPAWLFPIRRLLYTRVRCSTMETLERFNNALKLNPSLSAHVIHFYMDFYVRSSGKSKIKEKHLANLMEELFHRFTNLKRLTVEGSIALSYFKSGLAKLPSSVALEELDVIGALASAPGWVAHRMSGRILTWTIEDASVHKTLKSLTLGNISMSMALPPTSRGLPLALQKLTLHNAHISNPHAFTITSPLTHINIKHGIDDIISHHEVVTSFMALLEKYSGTLEHLTYRTPYIRNPIGDPSSYQWICPQLPRLRVLHTDGVYFKFESPEMILHKCPQLEELFAYQRWPEKVIDDFITYIDSMPHTLRRVVFSDSVMLEHAGSQTSSRARPLDLELRERVCKVGEERNIEVSFGSPEKGESMA
ncbi:hypothetical protein FRC03_012700 [Tulasnella sp. 419]|nr:hypothetical protein FRC03_012700 [Tulasnella sp. 419]